MPYEVIGCDGVDRSSFLEEMKRKIGRPYTTFPMIFRIEQETGEETFVGGFRELFYWFESFESE